MARDENNVAMFVKERTQRRPSRGQWAESGGYGRGVFIVALKSEFIAERFFDIQMLVQRIFIALITCEFLQRLMRLL